MTSRLRMNLAMLGWCLLTLARAENSVRPTPVFRFVGHHPGNLMILLLWRNDSPPGSRRLVALCFFLLRLELDRAL
jgi:hypothetical protein